MKPSLFLHTEKRAPQLTQKVNETKDLLWEVAMALVREVAVAEAVRLFATQKMCCNHRGSHQLLVGPSMG